MGHLIFSIPILVKTHGQALAKPAAHGSDLNTFVAAGKVVCSLSGILENKASLARSPRTNYNKAHLKYSTVHSLVEAWHGRRPLAAMPVQRVILDR